VIAHVFWNGGQVGPEKLGANLQNCKEQGPKPKKKMMGDFQEKASNAAGYSDTKIYCQRDQKRKLEKRGCGHRLWATFEAPEEPGLARVSTVIHSRRCNRLDPLSSDS
jgi:hypothetical protein